MIERRALAGIFIIACVALATISFRSTYAIAGLAGYFALQLAFLALVILLGRR